MRAIDCKRIEHEAIKALYGERLPEHLSFLAKSSLDDILHCVLLHDGGILTRLTPQQYAEQIHATLADPLLSRVIARNHTREQWSNVKAFAVDCEQAYQAGMHHATADLSDTEIDTTSTAFSEQRESSASQAACDHSYPSASREVFRAWFKRGYHRRAQELEKEQESK